MKILVISGYSKLAVDINAQLRLRGFESTLLTNSSGSNECDLTDVLVISGFFSRFFNLLRAALYRYFFLGVRDKYHYYQDINEDKSYISIKKIQKKINFKPDAVLILFHYRLLTTRTISDLYRWSEAPIFWMLPDMSPMTGGCAYSNECLGYKLTCSNCPAISNSLMSNFSRETFMKKIKNLSQVDIKLITFSSPQYCSALSSPIFENKEIIRTFFPVDENIFKPASKTEVRAKLGVGLTKKVIFFGAADLQESRKGYGFLIEALNMLSKVIDCNNILLLIAGSGGDEALELPFEKISYGYVSFNKLAELYQAADVFVCPTIADSGPTMVNQSILCGTPVVAFKVGVSVDLVDDGKTGYLSEPGDVYELSNGLKKVLEASEDEKSQMQLNCVEKSQKISENNFYTRFEEYLIKIDSKNN